MDDDERLALCRQANAQVWAGEAQLRDGGAVAGDGETLVFTTGLAAGYWNGAIVLSEPADLSATLESVRAFFRHRQLPYGCLLPAELTEARRIDIRAGIRAASFELAAIGQALMALEPADLRVAEPPPGLDLRRVASSHQIEEHVAVVAATLGDRSPGSTALLHDFVAPQVGADGYLHLTGYVDGRPVCAATGTLIDDAIGVFGVGTLPTHRTRGYGSAITRAIAAHGFAHGVRLGWLTPSPMARSAYARLGFTELPGWSVLLPLR